MSSTTDRRSVTGQALVIFAFSILALLLVAALAFDVGTILLDRRDMQDAADSAALAGARCLPSTACARSRAVAMATQNGFTSGVDNATVTVGVSGTRIQVMITKNVDSIFAELANIAMWHPSALAVAIKVHDQPPWASLMALSPHDCAAIKITGTGVVSTYGDVQINSDCQDDALLISGQGNLKLQNDGLACWVVGGYKISGKGSGKLCDPPEPGVPLPFPVNGVPENTATPAPVVELDASGNPMAIPDLPIPDGCPGSATPATSAAPATCQFPANYKDTTWRFSPGYYPGGIKLQGGDFLFNPGIYELAGGGLVAVASGTSVTSVDKDTTTFGGGVLFYNTSIPNFQSGPIQLGGTDGTFHLWPLGGYHENCSPPTEDWERWLIFQDPSVTNEVVINGGTNDVEARGLIYAPTANVKVNGGTGTLTMDAIIAYTFVINGNGGNINVLNDSCALPTFSGYGLVI